ncbi:alpha/beta hydrolase [Uliginosibacterium sediminicola]|uniref:Alpha/beta fold hydrolase n=1 Tax=Uliginosibacterium sediminicola TaxID=2024550 RepID=A0ABU9Z2N0_9RHOO
MKWLISCLLLLFVTLSASAQSHTEESQVDTGSGVLYGSLQRPDTAAPGPVVLIIAGSGPTDRDGNSPLLSGHNDGLKQIAEALASQGIASLRYDKRGIAQSRAALPSMATLRLDDLANDAAAWLRQLRKDRRFNAVFVAGHSEGSLLGMLAAQQVPVEGFISLAGPAQRASDLLRLQIKPQLSAEDFKQADAALSVLEAGGTPELWPASMVSLFHPSLHSYVVSWIQRVPAQELARLDVPCLIIQGTLDDRVPRGEARALQAARPGAELLIVPGMTHTLKLAEANRDSIIRSYHDASMQPPPAMLDALVKFIRSHPKPGA